MTAAPWVVLLVATATLLGQPFKSGTDMVTIPVSVTNRTGTERVRDLAVDQFRVFENGVEQTVTAFSRERRAISLCIALDSSMSMEGTRQRLAADAVGRLIAGLEPDDEIALVVFAGHAEVPIPWTRAAVFPRIDWANWKTVPNTALLDGLRRSLDLMDASHNSRAAILLVSDGDENSSKVTVAKVAATRRQSETLVYAFRMDDFWNPKPAAGTRLPPIEAQAPAGIGPMPAPPERAPPDVLSQLVTESGGWSYPIHNAGHTAQAAGSLLDELRYQYVLGYSPRNAADGTYRKLKVEMRNREFRVRYRAGYLAKAAQ